MHKSSNPQMKSERCFLVAVIALLAAYTIATWGTEQKAAASSGQVVKQSSGQVVLGQVVRWSLVRPCDHATMRPSDHPTNRPYEHGDPPSTPQPGSGCHGESSHSPGAMLGSAPLSLTGSYYQWGWVKTCRDVDWSTNPPTCVGETNTFNCDDEEIHNVAMLYNVTHGGYALIELYMPDGSFYGDCEIELDDPHQYGYDYWTWYSFECWWNISGSAMVQYPGWWHTEVYIWDYSQWINEAILWWELKCEGPPTHTPTITPTPTPTRTPTAGSGIYGCVTANLSPAAGVTLDLRLWDGSSWSTLLTTTTASNGTYNFIGAPSLTSGQTYHVRYLNADGTSGLLWGWWGPNITSYTAGGNVPGGDFDLADVGLGNPNTTTPQGLPVTFHWTTRNIASDTYELEILDAETYEILWHSGDLGRVSSFTLTSLPSGINPGTVYGWDVCINNPQGVGFSYGTNFVAFTTGPVPPTATPTATATPRPGMNRRIYLPLVLKNYRVLCNGNFEQATLGPCWTSGGELPASLVTQLSNGEPARGQRTLLLGNPALGPVLGDSTMLPPGSAWVEQMVSVPATSAPRLSFQHRVFTYDRSCVGGGEGRTCQKPSDNLVVSINDKPVSRLGYEGAWSGPPPLQDLGWRLGTVDLTTWRGQTVRVRFALWNDEFNYGRQSKGSYNTWGYVDDVEVSQ